MELILNKNVYNNTIIFTYFLMIFIHPWLRECGDIYTKWFHPKLTKRIDGKPQESICLISLHYFFQKMQKLEHMLTKSITESGG